LAGWIDNDTHSSENLQGCTENIAKPIVSGLRFPFLG
jgi:hypothetical protein